MDSAAGFGGGDDYAPAETTVETPVDLTVPPFAQPHVHMPVHEEMPVAAVRHGEPAPVAVQAPEEAPKAAAAEPVPARVAPLPETPVDPNQPKRSGWWQRAKQSFGG